MARILIIDDSPTQLFSIRRIVEKLDHQVITASDGATGVEAAKTTLPDLILMDVVMPNINGFQATRMLKRSPDTQNIPVILITTKDQDTDRMWGLRQGATAYLTKPFSEAELSNVITDTLKTCPPSNSPPAAVLATAGAAAPVMAPAIATAAVNPNIAVPFAASIPDTATASYAPDIPGTQANTPAGTPSVAATVDMQHQQSDLSALDAIDAPVDSAAADAAAAASVATAIETAQSSTPLTASAAASSETAADAAAAILTNDDGTTTAGLDADIAAAVAVVAASAPIDAPPAVSTSATANTVSTTAPTAAVAPIRQAQLAESLVITRPALCQ
jgi:twitching motility two-component system response regulator PilH